MSARGGAVAVVAIASLALAGAPSIVHAHPHAVTRATRQPPPPPDVSASFEHHRDNAAAAMQTGDWDLFLDESEDALRALPESENTHADRAEIMQPVGMWEVGARTDAQLHRSVSILDLYIEQLRQAHGDLASDLPGWGPAHQYLDDLRSRLPTTTAAPPNAPTVEGTPPPPPPIGPEPRDRGASPGTTAMIIGGGVTTGVGGVLTIVGLALVPRWVSKANEYEELEGMGHLFSGTEFAEREQEAWDAYTNARARSLGPLIVGGALLAAGVTLTVLGVHRRKKESNRVSVAPGGFHLRF